MTDALQDHFSGFKRFSNGAPLAAGNLLSPSDEPRLSYPGTVGVVCASLTLPDVTIILRVWKILVFDGDGRWAAWLTKNTSEAVKMSHQGRGMDREF